MLLNLEFSLLSPTEMPKLVVTTGFQSCCAISGTDNIIPKGFC